MKQVDRADVRTDYTILIISGLALFNIFLHLIVLPNLEYHRDELLYFSLSQHPAFGYATVPPLTGMIAWVMKSIFGYSLFAVRLYPALLSGGIVFLTAGIARELGGSGYSRILAATGIIISVIGLRTFLMFQPVCTDLFFWTLTFYLVIKFINTQSGKYLLLLGVMAGLALLNKYLIALLFGIILVVVPFTQHRSVFRNRNLWYGLMAGFLVFMPNLVWQILNGFPVFGHLAELERTQLVNVDRMAFLREQLIIPGIATFLTIPGFIFLLTGRKEWKFRFIAVVAISVVITLMLLHGKNYYTQGIFPVLIAAGGVAWEAMLKKTWSRAVLLIFMVLLTLPGLPMGVPVFKQKELVDYFTHIREKYRMDFVTRFEDNSIHTLPQDYADMLGWEELTEVTAKAWSMVPDKKSAFIYCENYGEAGAIAVIGKKYGLPQPVSFNESFRYWIPRKFDPDITTMVYINDVPGEDVKQLFSRITMIGGITDPDAREYGTSVYLCQDPVDSFNKFWTMRIKDIH
ncbi:MAG: glycosyltransferase family 39 protein [Bacteroidales bacterium]